jgi:hypothetical protein
MAVGESSGPGTSAVGLEAPQVHTGGYASGVEEHLAGKIEAAHLLGFMTRAFMVGLFCAIPFWLLGLVVAISGSGVGGAMLTLGMLAFFLAALGSLFIPFREAISSWWALVDGRADAADSAYAAIFGTLQQRNYPMAATPRRVRNSLSATDSARNYLVISYGKYVVYVSVFGYGTALYMGWTMWRRQYPIVMFWGYLKQTFDVVTGHGTLFHLILRAEDVQAFREALHSSVKQGLDVALDDLRIPIAATFGYEVPVESLANGSPGAVVSSARVPLPPMPSAAPPGGSR